MRNLNTKLVWLSLYFLLLSTCTTPTTTDEPSVPTGPSPMLDSVPADTLVFAGGTEPMPDRALQVVIDGVERLFEVNFRPDHKLHDVVNEFLGEEPSPAALTNLGIARNPRVMLYSHGYNPVLRIDVSDHDRFDAFFADLASLLSTEVEPGHYDGTDFQALTADDDLTVLARHDEGQVVIALVAPEDVGASLPAYTDSKHPEQSLSDSRRFEKIRQKRGYEAFLVGFIDWEQIISRSMDAEATASSSNSLFRPRQDHRCAETLRAAVSDTPELVFGFEIFDDKHVRFTAHQAIDPALVERLDKAAAPGIVHDSDLFDDALAEVIFAAAPFELAEQLDRWANGLAASESRCSPFHRVAKSLPPELTPVRGIRAFLTSIAFENDTYSARIAPDAGVLLASEHAMDYARALSNALPIDLTEAEIDGEPVSLDEVSQATPLGDVQALLRTGWIGIGLGERATARLAKLDEPGDDTERLMVSARVQLGALSGVIQRKARARLGEARNMQEELDLSDDDLDVTKAYLDTLEANLPDQDLEVSARVELLGNGITFVYERRGSVEYALSGLNPFANQVRYDAVRRVLRWRLLDTMHEANVKEARIEIQQLSQMVEFYYIKTSPHRLPQTLDDLERMNLAKDVPDDPWGEPYRYRRIDKDDFEIRSAGGDGEFETEDDILDL